MQLVNANTWLSTASPNGFCAAGLCASHSGVHRSGADLGQEAAQQILGQYTALGDTFLENLLGLTTLKIYQSDGFKNKEMNAEAEKFRKITMRALSF